MTEDSIEAIVAAARLRAEQHHLPYCGALLPHEAHQLVQARAAHMVDVRTRFEAEYVGRVAGAHLIEWRSLGSVEPNAQFLQKLAELGSTEDRFLFLCRSGARSHAAAATAAAAGYRAAFNILEGFEGELDAQQHRGTTGGWRFRGLPWIQS